MLVITKMHNYEGVKKMVKIREVDSSAKQRVKQRTKGFQERLPYRMAVANLTPDKNIELEPDDGESLRKLKLNLARAGKEVGRNIGYGESDSNTIIAWLAEGDAAPKRRRGRRKEGEA